MKLRLEFEGKAFDTYAVVLDDGYCPFEVFLERLRREDAASYKSLVALLRRHSDSGVVGNERKSRHIRGHGKLCEFKTRRGARLLYLYLPGKRTVLIDGFRKSEIAELHFSRAARIGQQFLGAQQ